MYKVDTGCGRTDIGYIRPGGGPATRRYGERPEVCSELELFQVPQAKDSPVAVAKLASNRHAALNVAIYLVSEQLGFVTVCSQCRHDCHRRQHQL
jgi:glycyl-tRNA synthetase alpha subunit